MAKNIIGIDISDFSIEAITLEKSKGSFKIVLCSILVFKIYNIL